MWFVEAPWPPAVLFATASAICVLAWMRSQRSELLLAAGFCVVGIAAAFAIDKFVVTDGEEIEANIYELTAAFQQKDRSRTHALISGHTRAKWIHDQIDTAFESVDVKDDMRVTDVSVEMKGLDEAESHFRANATLDVRGYGNAGYKPSRWRFGWVREDGKWKVMTLVRLNVIDGKNMEVMHRGE